MSAQYNQNKKLDQSKPEDRYYFVSPASSQTNNPITFSELLKRESGAYESVTDFERIEYPSPRTSAQYTCQRCHKEIGNRPFCYRCFGPPEAPKLPEKMNRKVFKVFIWVFVGFIIPMTVFMCFSFCIMHLYKIGLYRNDDIAQLKLDMKIALSEMRYLSSFTDGFMNKLIRNMTVVFGNIIKIKGEIVKHKSHNVKMFKSIQEIFDASCEEYIKTTTKTKVANLCSIIHNGTYFQ